MDISTRTGFIELVVVSWIIDHDYYVFGCQVMVTLRIKSIKVGEFGTTRLSWLPCNDPSEVMFLFPSLNGGTAISPVGLPRSLVTGIFVQN